MRQVFSNVQKDSRIIVMFSDNNYNDGSNSDVKLDQMNEVVENFDPKFITLQNAIYYLHYSLNKCFEDKTLYVRIEREKCTYYVKYEKGVLASLNVTEEKDGIYFTMKYESKRLGCVKPQAVTEDIRFNMYGCNGQIVDNMTFFREFQDNSLNMCKKLRAIEKSYNLV